MEMKWIRERGLKLEIGEEEIIYLEEILGCGRKVVVVSLLVDPMTFAMIL